MKLKDHQSIRNLIKEYLENEETERPLSIAVFGPPGSGKSFGVTELAKSIDKNIKKLEFNVSQFINTNDLVSAFHKVRDTVLEGKIPLVFFDEFDSSKDINDLGWIKYFLAPMQDGQFKDGDNIHPIGKSIFVFAGGTCSNFDEFSNTKDDKKIENFRNAKGTDFVSKLRGYVNILGPNPINDSDLFYIIRRGILLRSLLERKTSHLFDKNIMNIDSGVLRAFLLVPIYKHGVRSMEAIIDMVFKNRNKYEQSALPSKKQLDMHVDSEMFTKIVSRDALFNVAMENLAIRIHEQYLNDQKDKKPKHPSMQSWENLNEDLKESNRKQAQQIPEKLWHINLDFMPAIGKIETNYKFSTEQIEILSEMEHERWNEERLSSGWILDKKITQSDPNNKGSPFIVPWSELPDDIKDYDRNAIKNIPQLLNNAGFKIYTRNKS